MCTRQLILAACIGTLLTACGGGGGGADNNAPPPVVAAQPSGIPVAVAAPTDKVSKYDLEGATVAGGIGGAASGNFQYDWTIAQVTGFAFATPLGLLDSSQPGNTVSYTVNGGYTSLVFSNSQLSLTLNYAGAPAAGNVGFFSGVLCTVAAPCAAGGQQFPVSKLASKTWSSNKVWVPDLVWVPNLVTVTSTVWQSDWVWMPDVACNATDASGNCTDSTDNGFWEDDGSYVDQDAVVDQGAFVDDGAFVDTGTYPVGHFKTGLTVLSP